MKAVFVSYRFTGVDKQAIEKLLTVVCRALQARGVRPICVHFDVPRAGTGELLPQEAMKESFRLIDEAGALFVVQDAEARSEGMLMEVGYCIAKGYPVLVATQADVKLTYLPVMADMAVRWEDMHDLERVIGEMDLGAATSRV